MASLTRTTPLSAIRAVALDTETTGLDVKRARLIEVGAVHVDGDQIDRTNAFQSLVACAEPIPASATAVHGLDAMALEGAPGFATLLPGLEAFLDGRVIIGHTIGFDIALLEQEAGRIGTSFRATAALDIRLLAQIVAPRLPSYSLDALAVWLNVVIEERHRALGDAMAAARVFVALVPRLREAGIRTVGEALAASRRVSDALAGAAPAAWEAAITASGVDAGPIPKLDSYPYRHRIADVMNPEPCFLPGSTPLRDALTLMADRRMSSVLVGAAIDPVEALGIVTERDVLRHIARQGADGLSAPLDALASRPVLDVPAHAFLYRAIGRMSARRIRHLAVTDEDARVVGIITTRDLLRLRAESAVALGDDIDSAPDVAALGRAWAKLPSMAQALAVEAVEARSIAGIVASEVGALTRRAAQIAEEDLLAAGMGRPPCPYAVLVLGSAGRGESLLAMDQDNAIVFAEGEPGGPQDRWFAELGRRMAATLDAVGVPFCKGGVMASEPAFRGSLALWRDRIGQWLTRSTPEDLLAVDIVFDFRAVHGDRALAARLWREAWSAAQGQGAFLKLLSEAAGESASSLGFLGRIRTEEDGRIDLKRAALKGIVTTARVLALHDGIAVHATQERLERVAALGKGGAEDLAAIARDHALVLDAILRQQLADITAGRPPDNRVDPGILPREGQTALRQALGRMPILDDLRRSLLAG